MDDIEEAPKILSIGTLDIEIHFTLTELEASKLNFNINNYRNISDLKKLFSLHNYLKFNIMDYLSISTSNFLLNILLYINRAFRLKSEIEFITINKMEYSLENIHIYTLIKESLKKNNILLTEIPISNYIPKIIFYIEVIDKLEQNILHKKVFNLFTKNKEPICKNDIDDYLSLISISENKFDYFIMDYINFSYLIKNDWKEAIYFYNKINKLNIKIITYFDSRADIRSEMTKKIIKYSNIIFTEKYEIFEYTQKPNINTFKKSFEKLIIFIMNLQKIIIQQTINNINNYYKEFNLIFEDDNKKNLLLERKSFFSAIFIGGFISRYIYSKSFKTCFTAGYFSINKLMLILISNKINIRNINDYNVIVPYNNTCTLESYSKVNVKKQDKKNITYYNWKKRLNIDVISNKTQTSTSRQNKTCSSFFNSKNNHSNSQNYHLKYYDKRYNDLWKKNPWNYEYKNIKFINIQKGKLKKILLDNKNNNDLNNCYVVSKFNKRQNNSNYLHSFQLNSLSDNQSYKSNNSKKRLINRNDFLNILKNYENKAIKIIGEK